MRKPNFLLILSILLGNGARLFAADCPNMDGTWKGLCRGEGKPDYNLKLVIEQKDCERVKIKRYENGSLFSVEDIWTGEPISNFRFSPDTETAVNSGTIGLFRFQSMFQTLQQNFMADVAGNPRNVRFSVHNKTYLVSESTMDLNDEWWQYFIEEPAYPESRRYSYNDLCGLKKVLPSIEESR